MITNEKMKRLFSTSQTFTYASTYNYKKTKYEFPFINTSETKYNLDNILSHYQNKSDINIELYCRFVRIQAEEYLKTDIVSIDDEQVKFINHKDIDKDDLYTNVLTNIIHREVLALENYFLTVEKSIRIKDIFVIVVVTHIQNNNNNNN